MTVIYKCDFCGKTYDSAIDCRLHEIHEHETNLSARQVIMMEAMNDTNGYADYICDRCTHCYYSNGYYAQRCGLEYEKEVECHNSGRCYLDPIPEYKDKYGV